MIEQTIHKYNTMYGGVTGAVEDNDTNICPVEHGYDKKNKMKTSFG